MPGVTDYLGLLLPTLEEYFDEENHVNTNMQIINDAFKTKVPAVTTKDMTLYVSTTGSNTNGDGTVSKPYATITKAISVIPQVVNHNVTVNVAAGTYAEDVVIAGICGRGCVVLQGAASLADTHIVNKIWTQSNTCNIIVVGFKAITTSTHAFFADVSVFTNFTWCKTDAVALGWYGFIAQNSNIRCESCLVSNKNVGIGAAQNGKVLSYNCSGTGNNVGVYATAGVVQKAGTQPSGTISDGNDKTYGGLIINSDGSLGGNAGGVKTTQARIADVAINSSAQNTWYDVVNITGKGVVSRISAFRSAQGSDVTLIDINLIVDGVSQVLDIANLAYTRGIGGDGRGDRGAFFDYLKEIAFNSSLRIQVRNTSSVATLYCSVDYGLV